MKRRKFVKAAVVSGVSSLFINNRLLGVDSHEMTEGEMLYNGIKLPSDWPPKNIEFDSLDPIPVPYLKHVPAIIPIDVGRQLFVDSFLVENTNLKRVFHNPKKLTMNPIFSPTTELEKGDYGQPFACPKDGGVWWDENEGVFKMWYEAGWLGSMGYATSKDGLSWGRPITNPDRGNNHIVKEIVTDSTTVFIDHDTDIPEERYKMFIREPNFVGHEYGILFTSADGIRWQKRTKTGICGDRTTMFYNPFRKKWIYSIRSTKKLGVSGIPRTRFYHEADDFLIGGAWDEKCVFWSRADILDKSDPVIKNAPQLYNLSAVGYESLMLGLHEIHLGPENNICTLSGSPKTTELMVSFSRDGFHWDRPMRDAFIPATRQIGDWDRGYVQSVGGICTVVGDELRFYYSGVEGDNTNLNPTVVRNGMYANGSTGIAVLRRDGFASMDAANVAGILQTRPIIFSGHYLFVNVDCDQGSLTVEILDTDNRRIPGFTKENCIPVVANKTIHQVRWKDNEHFPALANRPVKLRFYLTSGKLYSFWVSSHHSGASNGSVAAGGPGFGNGKDDQGLKGYEVASSYQTLLEF